MKREISIYLLILLSLSLFFHFDQWITYPLEHLINLKNSGAYGLGYYHPFVFALLAYILLLIPRWFIKLLIK